MAIQSCLTGRIHGWLIRGNLQGCYKHHGNCMHAASSSAQNEPEPEQWEAIQGTHLQNRRNLSNEASAVGFWDQQGIPVSPNTLSLLLKRCIDTQDLTAGNKVYDLIVRSGLESDSFLGSYQIRLFAECASLLEANHVFSKLPAPNVFAWSAIISAHAKFGQQEQAIGLFHQMQKSNERPDGHVFVAVLKACACGNNLTQGKLVHAHAIRCGYELNLFVVSTLIDMYIKGGHIQDACFAFNSLTKRDVVTWTALISGLAQHGKGKEAFGLFKQMQKEGIEPNQATFVNVLKACSSIESLCLAKLVHANIVDSKYESDVVICNNLIDMYSKCVSLYDALKVFDRMPEPDRVSWCAMITGYIQNGQGREALHLFRQMQQEGVQQDQAIYVCLLKACSDIAALYQGKMIHAHVFETEFESDVLVGNTLIDMYVHCGSLDDACKVFDRLPRRNLITWSAIISGCAQHGNYNLAMLYFKAMHLQGLKPNDVTYACLLSTCSHGGLVREGIRHFKSMTEGHGIAPTLVHYNCLIDLLGHAGCLNEADDLLETIPFRLNIVGWTSLLYSCKIYGQVDLGRQCFDHVLSMDGTKSAGYVLMSNIYAHSGMLLDACKMEELRKGANVWKMPGVAFIELENMIHQFSVCDKSHQQSTEILTKLISLGLQIKRQGYVPQVDKIQMVPDEDKGGALPR